MKVLLLIPSYEEEGKKVNVIRDVLYGCACKGKRIAGATNPPLALLSVATVLKKEGHEVKILDAQAENKSIEEIKEISKEYKILLLLATSMTFLDDIKVLREIKKVNPEIKNILFGAHATFRPEECLKEESVDIVVIKEPEFIVRDLINKLEQEETREKLLEEYISVGEEFWKKLR